MNLVFWLVIIPFGLFVILLLGAALYRRRERGHDGQPDYDDED